MEALEAMNCKSRKERDVFMPSFKYTGLHAYRGRPHVQSWMKVQQKGLVMPGCTSEL